MSVGHTKVRHQPFRIGLRRGREVLDDAGQLRLRKAIEEEMRHDQVVVILGRRPARDVVMNESEPGREDRAIRSQVAGAPIGACARSRPRNQPRPPDAREAMHKGIAHPPRPRSVPDAAGEFLRGRRRGSVATRSQMRSSPATDTRAQRYRNSRGHRDERNEGREQNEIGQGGASIMGQLRGEADRGSPEAAR